METTFHNVTITIEADSPREAYGLLCKALGSLGDGFVKCCEWQTDTYQTVTEDGVESEDADSSELFPESAPECDTCPEHIHTFDVDCEACRAERLRTDVRTR
jgi:hypothetical protein